MSASESQKASLRINSANRDSMRTPVSGGRSPIPAYDDKQLSASWAGSDFSESRQRHGGKKLTDLDPISPSDPESGRAFINYHR